MKVEGPAKAMAIYVGEDDRWHGKPLYAAIVERAREMGLAGATVYHGIMGFGANSRIHTANILRLSEDLPVVIVMADKPDRIDAFLPVLDDMIGEGMAMTWDVNIELYRHNQPTD